MGCSSGLRPCKLLIVATDALRSDAPGYAP